MFELSQEDKNHILYMAKEYQADFDSYKQAYEYFYAITLNSLNEYKG